MDAKDKKYTYNRFGMKGARVGQAVHDILSEDQPVYTAEDILHEYSPKFAQELENCIEENKGKFDGPFYVFVLTGKEMWATNVVRNWFMARKTPPYALDMVADYPHRTKTLYLVDPSKGQIKICWSIPGIEECKTVINDPKNYDEKLVRWILDCFSCRLEKDTYSFDQL